MLLAGGGALRWESKAAIGYGVQQLPDKITPLDTSRPIYDSANTYVDAFVTYKTRLWRDKCDTTIQLNVRNLMESGGLQPVGAFPNGDIHTYRIVDPRQFILQAHLRAVGACSADPLHRRPAGGGR